MSRRARRGRKLQKAVREQRPHQREQRRDDERDEQHRTSVARADAADEIERIRRALDLLAIERGVGDERFHGSLRLEDEEIIDRDTRERDDDRDEILAFELAADLCDEPAERAGEREDKGRNEHRQQHAAEDRHRRCRDTHPVDDDRRHDDDRGVHKSHQVDPEQARSHQRPHRNGEREQQVVVLCGIQPRVGVEHAAERAEKDRHQAHDRKVEPAHPCLRERHAERKAHHREHSADDDDHHKGEKDDISDDCVF